MINNSRPRLRNGIQAIVTIILIIYVALSQHQNWELRIVLLGTLFFIQMVITVVNSQGSSLFNVLISLIGLAQIILATEEDLKFSSPSIFCSFETREIVFLIITFRPKSKKFQFHKRRSFHMIIVLVGSSCYQLIRIGLTNEISLLQILINFSLLMVRVIFVCLNLWGFSLSKIELPPFNFSQKEPSEQILSVRYDNPYLEKNKTKNQEELDFIFGKRLKPEDIVKFKSTNHNLYKSSLIEDEKSFSAYQKLLDILPEGVVLFQNVDDNGLITSKDLCAISYTNDTVLKMFNVENKNDLMVYLKQKKDFEQIQNLRNGRKSDTISSYYSMGRKMLDMYQNKKSFHLKKKKGYPSLGLIKFNVNRVSKYAASQRAIQKPRSPRNAMNFFFQSDPDVSNSTQFGLSLGDHINKMWGYLDQEKQQLNNMEKIELFGIFMLKIPLNNKRSWPHESKQNTQDQSNLKEQCLHVEVSIYGTVINNLMTLILLCRDVSHRSYIDILNYQNKNQSKTISYVSHEFRTPLSCMIQMLEASLQLPEGGIAYIKSTLVNAKHLLGLSNDLLDLAQIKVGKFQINNQSIVLKELINECLDMFQILAERQNIKLFTTFETDVPDSIISDPKRVKQIIVNLIGNAFKFTIEGQIHIQISLQPPSVILVKVSDTGIGIRNQDKSKLFHAFGKLSETEGKQLNAGGVGLGLFISNQIARLIGPSGQIGLEFESEFQKGTSFEFQILDLNDSLNDSDESYVVDLLKASHIDESSSDDSGYLKSGQSSNKGIQQNLQRMMHFSFQPKLILNESETDSPKESIKIKCDCNDVLIVDDNQFNIEMLKLILKQSQVTKVDSTISGIIAEQIVQAKINKKCIGGERCTFYRLIFMDIEMPLQDGITTIINIDQILLENSLLDNCIIIGCSGYSSIKEQNRCLEAGASEYLVKPIVIQELKRVLDLYYRVLVDFK